LQFLAEFLNWYINNNEENILFINESKHTGDSKRSHTKISHLNMDINVEKNISNLRFIIFLIQYIYRLLYSYFK